MGATASELESGCCQPCSSSSSSPPPPESSGSREPRRVRIAEPEGASLSLPVEGASGGGRQRRRTTMVEARSVEEQTGFHVHEEPGEARWLTEAMGGMWDFVEASIQTLLQKDIAKQIREDVPLMNSFEFSECRFGSSKPSFGPMKVRYKGNCLELLIQMHWDAQGSEFEVTIQKMKLGMKNIQLKGPILLVFSPLLNQLPITGGLSITFPDPPALSWTWTGLGKALAVDKIKKEIVHALFQTLVVPARVYVDIADLAADRSAPVENRVESYRSPVPIGALHIEVLEARQLPVADFGLLGRGSSDPYVVVKIGNGSFQTSCQHKTLDPVWGPAHSCDLLVYHMEQHVFIDVYDADMVTSDDLLGYVCDPSKGSQGSSEPERPTVAQFVKKSQTETWWALASDEDEGDPAVKIRCYFREVPEGANSIQPIPVNCNEKCGLVEVAGSRKGRPRCCSLCGNSFAKSWDQLCCGGGDVDQGQECKDCNFRCCSLCLVNRRPAAGILRICIREGLVPQEDAEEGVVLGVKFEDEMLWCKASQKPHYGEDTGRSNTQRWIRNLCTKFDKASVSKCLQMTPEKIQEVLDMHLPESTKAGNPLEQEPVIWDHALHYLVRNPHDQISATVVYKGKTVKVERSVAILDGRRVQKLKQVAQRLARRKMKLDGSLPCSEDTVEVTWTLDLDGKGQQKADIFVEITITPLAPV